MNDARIASPLLRLALGCWVLSLACGDDDTPASQLTQATAVATAECNGTRIDTGVDSNGNGTLDEAEINDTTFVCDGVDGMPGTPGDDAELPLVVTTPEPAGANCTVGGTRVDAGVDASGDGNLQTSEITSTTYVCDGEAGASGAPQIVSTSSAAEGACDRSGILLQAGVDADGNGIIEGGEVQASSTICDGDDGFLTLTSVTPEDPGANCGAGGLRVDSGPDVDEDGILDVEEVFSTGFLCDQPRPIVETSVLAPGDDDCASGGTRIDSGLDLNGDGVLIVDEVVSTVFVCNGAGGALALVSQTDVDPGDDCAFGGRRLAFGIDDDGDGQLGLTEEDSVSFVCAGSDGADGTSGSVVRVEAEPAGSNCPSGGTRILSGIDGDGDGALDDIEVASTLFVCSAGAAVARVQVTTEPPGANCADGGRRVESGLDIDGDGSLSSTEVQSTTFACNQTASVPIRILTTDLGNAIPNSPFSATVEAIGGIGGDYTWAPIDPLPAGLTLGPSGTPSTQITGTPSVAGNFSFRVQVTDFFGNIDDETLTLEIREPVSFASTILPRLASGSSYSGSLTATGGTGPYTFSLVSGSLPAGLSLSLAGLVSGTPSTAFGSRFIVQVEDSAGGTAQVGVRIAGEQNHALYCGDYIDNSRDDLSLVTVVQGALTSTGTIVTIDDSSGSPVDIDCFDVAFSPAKDQLAYISNESSDQLVLVDFSDPTNIETEILNGSLSSGQDVFGFAFSSDGDFIAYVADENTSSDNELFVVNISGFPGSGPQAAVVANNPLPSFGDVGADSFSAGEIRWAPGTHKIVFVGDVETASQDELFIYDADNPGAGALKINQPLPSSTAADVDTDSWRISPDGTYVAYVAEVTASAVHDAFIVDISGATPGPAVQVNNPLATNGDVGLSSGDLEFSPNGQWLAYIADEDNLGDKVYLRDLLNLSTSTGQRATPSLGTTLQNVISMVWSPDGRRLAVEGDLLTDNDEELFVVDTFLIGSPIRLNPPMVTDGDITSITGDDFQWAPGGNFVAYIADQDVDGSNEPYVVGIDNPGTAIRLSGMGLSDDAFSVRVSSDGEAVLYVGEEVATSGNSLVYVDFNPVTVGAGPKVVVNTPTGTTDDVDTADIRFIGGSLGVFYVSAEDQGGSADEGLFRSLGPASVGGTVTINPPLPSTGDVAIIYVQEE